MSIEKAIAVTIELKAALASEITNARTQRELLHSFNGERILDMAAQRDAFNHRSAWLQQQLAEALANTGREFSLATVSLEAISTILPIQGERLRDELSQIRSLASSLADLDELNQLLAERALSCVRAYTQNLQPAATAYDKRGLHAATPSSTLSQRI